MNKVNYILQDMVCITAILLSFISLVSATTTITFPATSSPYSGTPTPFANNTLGCFQNNSGGLGSISCVIGTGFASLFGPVFLNIFVLIIAIVLCFKLRLPLDLSAIAVLTLLIITNITLNTTMIYYGLALIILIVVGYGFYKFWRR